MTGMRGKREHLVYWFILLLFILAAAESLGLPRVTETLGVLVAYVPNILAAVLILLLGSILAHIIGDAVRALAVGSGLSGGQVLGQVTRYTILGITINPGLGTTENSDHIVDRASHNTCGRHRPGLGAGLWTGESGTGA